MPRPADAFAAFETSDALTHSNNFANRLVAGNTVLERAEFTARYSVVGVTDAASQHLHKNLTCTGPLER